MSQLTVTHPKLAPTPTSYRQMHKLISYSFATPEQCIRLAAAYSPSYKGLRLIVQGVDPGAFGAAFRTAHVLDFGAAPFGRFVGDGKVHPKSDFGWQGVEARSAREIETLHAKIGQLTIENDPRSGRRQTLPQDVGK